MDARTEAVYTPTELNREVKLHIEAGFPRVTVEGEISNLGRPPSGHIYFSLKDERAQLKCAMFRSAVNRTPFRPENGMLVTVRGRVSLYVERGEYQFVVESMKEAGEGALQRRFEELKKKLEAEGLFDPSRRKPLPAYPRRIALITSPSGAAVRDLVDVIGRRWPLARLRLYPVTVQGADAPPAIRAALAAANRHGWADVLIVGRGGGSLEDLWAFNDEGVARAVAASGIPVVSAVGHETDFTICDFVADLRAPTPSAAAELATPDGRALLERFRRSERQLRARWEGVHQRNSQALDHLSHRLQQQHPENRLRDQAQRLASLSNRSRRSVDRAISERRQRVSHLARRLDAHRPDRRLAEASRRIAVLSARLSREMESTLRDAGTRVRHLARTLNAVSPLETIARGYAVITGPEGKVVSKTAQVERGDSVTARLSDGSLELTVDDKHGPDSE